MEGSIDSNGIPIREATGYREHHRLTRALE